MVYHSLFAILHGNSWCLPSLSFFLPCSLLFHICLRIRRLYFVPAGVIRKLSNSTLESYHKHPILILVLVITVAHVEYQERRECIGLYTHCATLVYTL